MKAGIRCVANADPRSARPWLALAGCFLAVYTIGFYVPSYTAGVVVQAVTLLFGLLVADLWLYRDLVPAEGDPGRHRRGLAHWGFFQPALPIVLWGYATRYESLWPVVAMLTWGVAVSTARRRWPL